MEDADAVFLKKIGVPFLAKIYKEDQGGSSAGWATTTLSFSPALKVRVPMSSTATIYFVIGLFLVSCAHGKGKGHWELTAETTRNVDLEGIPSGHLTLGCGLCTREIG
ncbi:hypothetical protein Salat_2923300 [Sesamum alatum]|uniref:Uncharacterized protein n=1 Tax=Sesamum alatum TaxID=300844 RepID=A0AAE2C8C6_9LAMI|nr:hypothetical protein Salat_2923300 [Sesamum alatum]